MICQKCGSFNNDDSVFCTTCGADLKNQAPATPVQPAAPYQPQAPYQAQPYQPQPYQPQPYQQPVNVPKPKQPGMGLAIAGMVLGIISLLCFPYITGVLGIIFGAVAKSKGCRSGMATAAIVTGAIGVGLWLVMLVACSGMGGDMYMELLEELM